MSTKLNGNRYSRRGDRVPVNLLPSAIAWEECRTQVCMALGRTSDAYRRGPQALLRGPPHPGGRTMTPEEQEYEQEMDDTAS